MPTDPELHSLSRTAGLPLHAYNQDHIAKQLRRAIRSEGLEDVGQLASLISRDDEARSRLRAAIAVSVSGRLRDPEQFKLLERDLLPDLLELPGVVRIWSAGCADGSELFDIARLLEQAGALQRSYLLGSDIMERNLRAAAAQSGPHVSPTLRARMRWERRNLVSEPAPPGNWRLILCRNLAIYLRGQVRDTLHRKLAGALGRGGVLMLGRSERIGDPERIGLTLVGAHAYRRSL